MLESQSRAVMTRITAKFPLKTWVKKLTLGIGIQGLVTSTKMHKPTPVMMSPTNKPKLSNFNEI